MDRTFGFFGSDRFDCWYKDVKDKRRKEVFSTKGLFCPTNERNARRTSCQVGNFGEVFLQDVQTGGQVFLVPFSDGYLITKYIDSISPDIVNFIDVDDIGPMDFEKGLSDQFFFHILQGAIGDIAFSRRDELDVVAHTFEEEDIVFLEFDQFVLRLDEEKIAIGQGGGIEGRGGRWCGYGIGGL